MLSWAEAQEQFSLGAEAMSQGSGSPINLLDPETCDRNLQYLRGADGQLPDFDSVGSEPGSPPSTLELEVTHGERGTQTSPAPTHDKSTDVLAIPTSTSDQATQVLSRPHQGTSATQTPSPATSSDESTQVLLRPPRSVAFTQTERPATSRTTSCASGPRRTGQH